MEEDDQGETHNNDDEDSTKSGEESPHVPEMRTMTVPSIPSEDETPYSELDGTQYDSEGSYGNAMGSAPSSEDYYSVSEDEFGFRIPQLRAMRITEESEQEQESQGAFARLRRNILHRRRTPSNARSSDGTGSDGNPDTGDISDSMPSLHSVQSLDTEITEDEEGETSDAMPSLVSISDL